MYRKEKRAVEVSLTANPRTKMLTASALRIVEVTPNSSSINPIPGAGMEDANGLIWLAFARGKYLIRSYLKNVTKLTRPKISHFLRSRKFLLIVRD